MTTYDLLIALSLLAILFIAVALYYDVVTAARDEELVRRLLAVSEEMRRTRAK